MQDRKSIYSLNKADSDAIVYIDAEGHTIRLTRQNFATNEEFEKWKAWSDENFHTEEKSDHVYRNHTLRLSGLPEAALSDTAEQEKARERQHRRQQEQFSAAFVLEIRTRLTEIQFRRLWLYYIESKTVYEIAELDGVAHQNVSKAIKAAKKKILKIFQKQGAKQPSKRR